MEYNEVNYVEDDDFNDENNGSDDFEEDLPEEVPPPDGPYPPALEHPVVLVDRLDTPVPDGMRKRSAEEV